VLIDCGIAPRRIFNTLIEYGFDPHKIDAVLVTHIHGDHISGLPNLLKKVSPRIYCYQKAANYLARFVAPSGATGEQFSTFNGDGGFHHRDIDVLPVPVSHDADPTVAFKIFAGKRRIGVLTDLGNVYEEQRQTFCDCDVLVLEANHCPELLATGPYPETIKARIRGSHGHLSNEQACEFASGLEHLPEHLLLGHLSESNNSPLAIRRAFRRIETGALPHKVLSQSKPGPFLELAP
jgi:phosphoribosyl 1,2-cyclic phosphodiesterase